MEIQTIKQAVVKFIKDEEGLTMVEYAVAGALVAVACVTAFTSLGTAIAAAIDEMIDAMDGAA